VTYPIGQSSAKAAAAQATLQKQQQDLSIQSLQLQIVSQVRDAVRNVQSGYKRVLSTQKARTANERQLDAETKKYNVGLSDTFAVLQKQALLAAARAAELQATIDYNRALIALERVQKIR
jgi:outer membrane protein TolC